jgi:tRNA(fMet)-specific endonuclease VapC
LLDGSVLIGGERRPSDLAQYTASRVEPVLVSVVTASELLHGVHRATDAARRAARSAFVEWALTTFPLVDIDLSAARIHAQLWAELSARGLMIGPHDLWIAASAVSGGLALATTNVREFRRVPGLIVDEWMLS